MAFCGGGRGQDSYVKNSTPHLLIRSLISLLAMRLFGKTTLGAKIFGPTCAHDNGPV